MSAPTTVLSSGANALNTTAGEGNGFLVNLPARSTPATLQVVAAGTFTSMVLAVKGKIPNGSVYFPLFGCTPAGTPISDSTALAPTDSTTTRYLFDVTGLDPTGGVEIYAVSGTLTAVTIEASVQAGGLPAVTNNTLSNQLALASAGSINDANGNEIIKSAATVSSAVNEITVTNAATGTNPKIAATGGDTNISLELAAKGTGAVRTGVQVDKRTQTAKADTATLTIANLLTKVIDGTPTAAATYTLPTAALLVAGIADCAVGDSFNFLVNNKSAGANTITVAAGSGGTGDGTLTVAQDVIRQFSIIVTNVTGSSEAYFVYGHG